MKKTSVLLMFLAFSFLALQNNYAQALKIGIGGGFSFVQTPSFYTDVKGFSTEYHIGLKGKLDIPIFPFTPIGFVDYHFLRGTENSPGVSADTKQNILSIGVGGEFSLGPGPLSPYFGLDLEYNNFSDLETAGLPSVPGYSRMGIGIGIGAMVNLIIIDADIGLKYQMMNLIGKKSGEQTIGIINLNAAVFL